MAQTAATAGPVEGMEASPNTATQPESAGYQRAERPPMGVLTQGILADRRLLGPLLRPAQRLLGQPRPTRVRRTLPPLPGMLSEPPDADPHVRWCGGRRGEPGAYPIGLNWGYDTTTVEGAFDPGDLVGAVLSGQGLLWWKGRLTEAVTCPRRLRRVGTRLSSLECRVRPTVMGGGDVNCRLA